MRPAITWAQTDLYAYDHRRDLRRLLGAAADDWTGYPIGFEPPAVDPWHLDNWGWLEPMVITDSAQVYTVTIGQASRFPGEEGMYRGAKIVLPEGNIPLPVQPMAGGLLLVGRQGGCGQRHDDHCGPDRHPRRCGEAALSFDLAYEIEAEWDFLGPGLGGWHHELGFPDQRQHPVRARSGLDWRAVWLPRRPVRRRAWEASTVQRGLARFETQEFDLSAYAGKSIYLRFWFMTDWATTYGGAFVDNVQVVADGAHPL